MAHLNSVLAYLIAAVSGEGGVQNSRLTKMVYLADWRHCIQFGAQLTSIRWVFNHFGPYVPDVIDTAHKSPEMFAVSEGRTNAGSPKYEIRLLAQVDLSDLTSIEVETLEFVALNTFRLPYDDFIRLVYSTYPVVRSERGQVMDLISLAEEYRELLKDGKYSPPSRPDANTPPRPQLARR